MGKSSLSKPGLDDESRGLLKEWGSWAKRLPAYLTELPDDGLPTPWLSGFRGASILDIGCGGGKFSVYLALLGNEAIGLDIVPDMLSLCQNNAKQRGVEARHHIILGDSRHLPFKNNVFDLVFSAGVVEHFPETQSALNEHVRVVKEGGSVVVGVPGVLPFRYLIRNIGRRIGILEQEKEYSIARFRAMLLATGNLNDIVIERQSYPLPKLPLPSWQDIGSWICRILDKPFAPIFNLIGLGGELLWSKGRKCPG